MVLLVIPENPASAGRTMNISVLVGKVAKLGVARSKGTELVITGGTEDHGAILFWIERCPFVVIRSARVEERFASAIRAVPPGLARGSRMYPALKRWAKIERPSGALKSFTAPGLLKSFAPPGHSNLSLLRGTQIICSSGTEDTFAGSWVQGNGER